MRIRRGKWSVSAAVLKWVAVTRAIRCLESLPYVSFLGETDKLEETISRWRNEYKASWSEWEAADIVVNRPAPPQALPGWGSHSQTARSLGGWGLTPESLPEDLLQPKQKLPHCTSCSEGGRRPYFNSDISEMPSQVALKLPHSWFRFPLPQSCSFTSVVPTSTPACKSQFQSLCPRESDLWHCEE